MTPQTLDEARTWLDSYLSSWKVAAHSAREAETLLALLAEARAEERLTVLQEVNTVFCGGLSSLLGLEHMRDMCVRGARAEGAAAQREKDARRVENFTFSQPPPTQKQVLRVLAAAIRAQP